VRRGAAAGRRAQGEAREQGRALPAALGERREKIHFFVVNRVVHYGKLLEILTSSSFRRGTTLASFNLCPIGFKFRVLEGLNRQQGKHKLSLTIDKEQ
jgi:hypothetical protein